MKVKTNGQAQPELLRADLKRLAFIPAWSPAGDWILYSDAGVKLISLDGQQMRDLNSLGNALCGFSSNGALLYCGRQVGDGPAGTLFSVNLEGKAEHLIGSLAPEYIPATSLNPALHFSLAPDGKSVTYSIRKNTSNLWLMDGLPTVK